MGDVEARAYWKEACTFFQHDEADLSKDTMIKLPFSRPGQTLRPYQLVDVLRILKSTYTTEDTKVRGHILAYAAGVGKTRVALGIIATTRVVYLNGLHVSNHKDLHKISEAGNTCSCKNAFGIECVAVNKQAKAIFDAIRPGPTIILVPPGIIPQWLREGKKFICKTLTARFTTTTLEKDKDGGLPVAKSTRKTYTYPLLNFIGKDDYTKEISTYKERVVAQKPDRRKMAVIRIDTKAVVKSLQNAAAGPITTVGGKHDLLKKYFASQDWLDLVMENQVPREDGLTYNYDRTLAHVVLVLGSAGNSFLSDLKLGREIPVKYTNLFWNSQVPFEYAARYCDYWVAPSQLMIDEIHSTRNENTNLFRFCRALQKCSGSGSTGARCLLISGTPITGDISASLKSMWPFIEPGSDEKRSSLAEMGAAFMKGGVDAREIGAGLGEMLQPFFTRRAHGDEFLGKIQIGWPGDVVIKDKVLSSALYGDPRFVEKRAKLLRLVKKSFDQQLPKTDKSAVAFINNFLSLPLYLESFPGLACIDDGSWDVVCQGLVAEAVPKNTWAKDREQDNWLRKYLDTVTQGCGKLQFLKTALEEIKLDNTPLSSVDRSKNEVILKKHGAVFSYRPRIAAIVAGWLDKNVEGWNVVFVGSKLSMKERDSLITGSFPDIETSKEELPTVFVTTTGVSATGVDALSAVRDAFMFDVPYGNATGEQAVARFARSGQRYGHVNFTTLVAEGGAEFALFNKHGTITDMVRSLFSSMQAVVT